jgi:hypothetical protein
MFSLLSLDLFELLQALAVAFQTLDVNHQKFFLISNHLNNIKQHFHLKSLFLLGYILLNRALMKKSVKKKS